MAKVEQEALTKLQKLADKYNQVSIRSNINEFSCPTR